MATETYTSMTGDQITYDSAERPEAAAFIARVRIATYSPQVTVNQLVDLVYGIDNPILLQGQVAGRGMVTPEVMQDPLWYIMTDLLNRKLAEADILNAERFKLSYEEHQKIAKPPAEFSMTIAQAAEQLGLTPNAVRAAVKRDALEARKIGGRWLLNPSDVADYRPVRGRQHRRVIESTPLVVTIGNMPGWSAAVEHDGEFRELRREGKRIVVGEITNWTKAMLRIKRNRKDHFFWVFTPDASSEKRRTRVGPFGYEGHVSCVVIEDPIDIRRNWRKIKSS
jgi:excisionase family DNA binding protein